MANDPGDDHGALDDPVRLMRLRRALEVLRKLEPDMQMQKATAFLIVATTPGGCTMKHIAREMGMYLSTANRNVAALGDQHWSGKSGLGLVTAENDPEEPRRKVITLTAKGRRVAKSVLAALGEG